MRWSDLKLRRTEGYFAAPAFRRTPQSLGHAGLRANATRLSKLLGNKCLPSRHLTGVELPCCRDGVHLKDVVCADRPNRILSDCALKLPKLSPPASILQPGRKSYMVLIIGWPLIPFASVFGLETGWRLACTHYFLKRFAVLVFGLGSFPMSLCLSGG